MRSVRFRAGDATRDGLLEDPMVLNPVVKL